MELRQKGLSMGEGLGGISSSNGLDVTIQPLSMPVISNNYISQGKRTRGQQEKGMKEEKGGTVCFQAFLSITASGILYCMVKNPPWAPRCSPLSCKLSS